MSLITEKKLSSRLLNDSLKLEAFFKMIIIIIHTPVAVYHGLGHIEYTSDMSLVVRKPVLGVSDQVLHKPGCAATEDS